MAHSVVSGHVSRRFRRGAAAVCIAVATASASCDSADEGPVSPPQDDPIVPTVASVAVTPQTVVLEAGETRLMSAEPKDDEGRPLTDRSVRWSSSNPLLAAISQDGLLTASEPGEVTVSAEVEGVVGTASVAVVQAAVTVVGAGDIADCAEPWDEATADLLDGIPGTVFTLGDNAYEDGTAQEYADCYSPTWGRHKDRTYPAVGNHEYHTADAAPHFEYFGATAGEPGKGYYAYEAGAWKVIVLNSNANKVPVGAGSAQEQWLRAELASDERLCTLAYWHHPRFSSGQHGDDDRFAALWLALDDFDVDVVMVGHEHHYERMAPLNPAGAVDETNGIRQFIVGTGGRYLRPAGEPRTGSEVRNSDTFGVLRLTLRHDSYEWQFVPVAGQSFTDAGSDTCR
jgi:hypothetical protein